MVSPPAKDRVVFTSTRFGDIDIPGDKLITFPHGLLGFEHLREFAVLDPEGEGSPLKWLHSTEDPDLAFVIMDPSLFLPAYCPGLAPDVAECLESGEDDALTLVIVTVPAGGSNITANLKAPLFINPALRRGYQAILGDDHPTRHPLLPPTGTEDAHAGP